MATIYRIPGDYVEGFELLSKLSDVKKEALLESIRQTEVGMLRTDLTTISSDKIGVTERELSEIFLSLNGIIFLKEHSPDSVAEFANSIVDAYGVDAGPEKFDKSKLAAFIGEFLNSAKNYKITMKANQLAYERDKVARRFEC